MLYEVWVTAITQQDSYMQWLCDFRVMIPQWECLLVVLSGTEDGGVAALQIWYGQLLWVSTNHGRQLPNHIVAPHISTPTPLLYM